MAHETEKQKIEIPEDLGLKINTAEGTAWENIKKDSIKQMGEFRRGIIMHELIVAKADEIIEEELKKIEK